jgi:hypothetical protein
MKFSTSLLLLATASGKQMSAISKVKEAIDSKHPVEKAGQSLSPVVSHQYNGIGETIEDTLVLDPMCTTDADCVIWDSVLYMKNPKCGNIEYELTYDADLMSESDYEFW